MEDEMVDYRLLLITPDGAVVISHPDHGEIDFPTIADCTLVTGVDLGRVRQMNYEPDNGFYFDTHRPAITVADAPNQQYEDMIDNVPLYQQMWASMEAA